ncbi:alpha/beta hydrolase [Kribbella antibiotica]|uniref:Alpha/beta hydrolase n=1 Tax=Kribbella antibiotica TaxID=190195 RepID=A0A4R4ZW79_9ACTN|nr:alpha/beta hydrolase [Kribbella antibiotica]TDD63451.1 alpha/beta hydrolase [Kribbella antibiotica]
MRIDVTFPSAGLQLAGHLYTPETAVPGPAIVVGHPGSGVKEQAAGRYAEQLAARGFVTLAFDAAYQGESEGLPRGLEDPAHRVEDLKAAVSFLTTRDEVDPGRIGVLGICAAGGYGIAATGTDHRIKALATVSGVDIARQFRFGADGNQDPAAVQHLLDAAADARTAEARGAENQTFPLFPATEEEARRGGRHVFEGWQYYRTPRGMHPRSAEVMPWTSVDRIVTFDAYRAADLIAPRPVLMIVGRAAVTAWMAVAAFQAVTGPKELHWIEGATHVDLYDREEYVVAAVAKLADFYSSL